MTNLPTEDGRAGPMALEGNELQRIIARHEYLEEHGWDVPPKNREHLTVAKDAAKRIFLANAVNAHVDRGALIALLQAEGGSPNPTEERGGE